MIQKSKLSANIVKSAMKLYLNHQKRKPQQTHGKVSVKKLMGEGVGVSSIEITDNNIKSFERVARKYHVDFAIKKDKTTNPPKYVVFFKGRDTDVLAQAFKEFVYGNEKKKGRSSIREDNKETPWGRVYHKNHTRKRLLDKGKEKKGGLYAAIYRGRIFL